MAEAFFYVDGDRNKVHIDPKDQPPGTNLVFVDEKGRDHHFIAGKTVVNDPVKLKERFTKGHNRQAPEA